MIASAIDTSVIVAVRPGIEERERRLIESVVSLAKSMREERERLARRLVEVEHELSVLVDRHRAAAHRRAGHVTPVAVGH
jgi:hypothetical protein